MDSITPLQAFENLYTRVPKCLETDCRACEYQGKLAKMVRQALKEKEEQAKEIEALRGMMCHTSGMPCTDYNPS